MKKEVNISGVITKHEKLIPLQLSNLPNIFVAEASTPYANYYGQVPRKAKPNSLFLFTKDFYYLHDIISCSTRVEKCLLEKINIASSILEWNEVQYPAIRLKNFPDYKQLSNLQSCMANQGIRFSDKPNITGDVKAKISKLFKLEETEDGFYFDLEEENKGYFTYGSRIKDADFDRAITQLKNNGTCKLFDAVHGEFLLDGSIVEMIRVYSEGLDSSLLKCIKKEFEKLI